MKFAPTILCLLASAACCAAQESPGAASAHFAIEHRVLDSAGGKSTTSRFQFNSSLDSFGQIATTTTRRIQPGFPGQLIEQTIQNILLGISVQPNGHMVLLQGGPNHTYQLQTAPSLIPPIAWSNLGGPTIAPANGVIQYQQANSGSLHFYRALEP